jgi:hypothetical protein
VHNDWFVVFGHVSAEQKSLQELLADSRLSRLVQTGQQDHHQDQQQASEVFEVHICTLEVLVVVLDPYVEMGSLCAGWCRSLWTLSCCRLVRSIGWSQQQVNAGGKRS